MTIDPRVDIGHVHLKVSDLERSLEFYCGVLGFELQQRWGEQAAFVSAGGYHHHIGLNTWESLGGPPPAPGTTGLYHVAIRYPDRATLGDALRRLVAARVPLQGASDHGVSEALYLADPDGHGIEIYWDRPRAVWDGQVDRRLTTLPLDADGLLNELDDPAAEPFEGLPGGTRMGHVHLRVAEIPETIEFYRDVLGFELSAALGGQAAFFAAGGYHHHIGANIWESAGASAPPPGFAALRHATILLPDVGERDRVLAQVAESGREPEENPDGLLVRDPSGNALLLTAGRPDPVEARVDVR